MAYSPTVWQDGVTPINAANLNKIEQALDAAEQAAADAQAKAEKGQPNGYAALGSDGLVPLAQLPEIDAGGGAELVFEGDWLPATAYQDGDYVMKDGMVYVCVGGPTTDAPDPTLWPVMQGTAPASAVGYGTTLPVAPVNGQEHILVDSLTAPTYQWRFRFNANATGLYKWEFIGGAALYTYDATLFQTTSTTFVDPNPAMSLAVPRAGTYTVRFGGLLGNTAGAGNISKIAISGPSAATDADSLQSHGGWQMNVAHTLRRTLTAPGSFGFKLGVNAGTAYSPHRWMEVEPVRVA